MRGKPWLSWSFNMPSGRYDVGELAPFDAITAANAMGRYFTFLRAPANSVQELLTFNLRRIVTYLHNSVLRTKKLLYS